LTVSIAHATVDDPHAPRMLRMNAAEAAIVPGIILYAERLYGGHWWHLAWDELWAREGVPVDPDRQPEFTLLFIPWLAFDWVPCPGPSDSDDLDWGEVPAARTYLDHYGPGLTPFRRRFIETALTSRFSLFRVVDVRRNDYLDLEDLLTGNRLHIPGRIESNFFDAGDIVYARVVSMDGEATLLGSAPWCIPAGEPFDVDALRQRLARAGDEPGEDGLPKSDRELRLRFLGAIGELCGGSDPANKRRARRAARGNLPGFLQAPVVTN
jgi:hypothetical protein